MPKPSLRTRLIDFALTEAKQRGLEAKVARDTVVEVLRCNPRSFRRRDPDALKAYIQEALETKAMARELSACIHVSRGTWGDEQTAKTVEALERAGFLNVRTHNGAQHVFVSMGYMTTQKQARRDAIDAIWTVTLGSRDWHLQTGEGLIVFGTIVRTITRKKQPVST